MLDDYAQAGYDATPEGAAEKALAEQKFDENGVLDVRIYGTRLDPSAYAGEDDVQAFGN